MVDGGMCNDECHLKGPLLYTFMCEKMVNYEEIIFVGCTYGREVYPDLFLFVFEFGFMIF